MLETWGGRGRWETNRTCVNQLQAPLPATLAQQTGIFVGNEDKSSQVAGLEQCTQRSSCSAASCLSHCWDGRELGPRGGVSCTPAPPCRGAIKSPTSIVCLGGRGCKALRRERGLHVGRDAAPACGGQPPAIAHIPFNFFHLSTIPLPCITCSCLNEIPPPNPPKFIFFFLVFKTNLETIKADSLTLPVPELPALPQLLSGAGAAPGAIWQAKSGRGHKLSILKAAGNISHGKAPLPIPPPQWMDVSP